MLHMRRYVEPCVAEGVLSQSEQRAIFGNLESLLEVNTHLLTKLEAATDKAATHPVLAVSRCFFEVCMYVCMYACMSRDASLRSEGEGAGEGVGVGEGDGEGEMGEGEGEGEG